MTRVLRRPAFIADATDAYCYLSDLSPRAADRFLEALEASIGFIAAYPEIGRAREKLMPGVRSHLLRRFRFVVFYRPIADEIVLLRLLHGARNLAPDMLEKADL